jgi:hypothetical protein
VLRRVAEIENVTLKIILEDLIHSRGEEEAVEEIGLGGERLGKPCEQADSQLVEAQEEVCLRRRLNVSPGDVALLVRRPPSLETGSKFPQQVGDLAAPWR